MTGSIARGDLNYMGVLLTALHFSWGIDNISKPEKKFYFARAKKNAAGKRRL